VNHVITIVISEDGKVQGDLDDRLALWPSRAMETSTAARACSVLEKALKAIELFDPAPRAPGGPWIPVTERLPPIQQVVQVRYASTLGPCGHYSTVGFTSYPRISDGNIPIADLPMHWFSAIYSDHKGRHDEISNVTHWAPLLDADLASERLPSPEPSDG